VAGLAIAILAAGASTRFGSPKQLASFRNTTLLGWVYSVAKSQAAADTFVVLGANTREIRQDVDLPSSSIIKNRHWQDGISSSIACAVKKLGEAYQAILFVAADQALVDSKGLAGLVALHHKSPHSIIASRYTRENFGVPALFPSGDYDALLTLTGDKGAKALIKNHDKRVLFYDWPHAGQDIDTVEDLEQISRF
jgi:molybdenum cofactor cytidylyltransferase